MAISKTSELIVLIKLIVLNIAYPCTILIEEALWPDNAESQLSITDDAESQLPTLHPSTEDEELHYQCALSSHPSSNQLIGSISTSSNEQIAC